MGSRPRSCVTRATQVTLKSQHTRTAQLTAHGPALAAQQGSCKSPHPTRPGATSPGNAARVRPCGKVGGQAICSRLVKALEVVSQPLGVCVVGMIETAVDSSHRSRSWTAWPPPAGTSQARSRKHAAQRRPRVGWGAQQPSTDAASDGARSQPRGWGTAGRAREKRGSEARGGRRRWCSMVPPPQASLRRSSRYTQEPLRDPRGNSRALPRYGRRCDFRPDFGSTVPPLVPESTGLAKESLH